MKKKQILIYGAIALVALIVIILVINKSEIEAKKQMTTTIEAVTVTAAKVEERTGSNSLSFVGATIANQEVQVLSETSGQVVNLLINLGDYVTQGKVMVQVDDKLRALNLESAKLNLEKMEDELKKTTNLYQGGAATETQNRDAKINYENAKIQVEQAEKQLTFTKIAAPINGYVSQKSVEKGSFVNIGSPIVYLVDVSQLKITLKVGEKDVYRIKQGQPVEIASNVHPGVKFSGKVSFISPKGDEFHNYPVEVALQNQSKASLRSGTFVNVKFLFDDKTKSLQIPRQALVGSIKDAKVYKIIGGRVQLVKIVIGSDNGDYFGVQSGLNAGDEVVTTGQINLADGDAVKVINQ
jgi:RND family efflux transporter MFP subunit